MQGMKVLLMSARQIAQRPIKVYTKVVYALVGSLKKKREMFIWTSDVTQDVMYLHG